MTAYRLPVFVAAWLIASPAIAFNTMFMRDSAISNMTDAEFELMTSTVYQALDDAADGDSVEWGDPAAAHGTVKPLAPFDYQGYHCRAARLNNYAGGDHAVSTLEFCRNAAGEWKILTRGS